VQLVRRSVDSWSRIGFEVKRFAGWIQRARFELFAVFRFFRGFLCRGLRSEIRQVLKGFGRFIKVLRFLRFWVFYEKNINLRELICCDFLLC